MLSAQLLPLYRYIVHALRLVRFFASSNESVGNAAEGDVAKMAARAERAANYSFIMPPQLIGLEAYRLEFELVRPLGAE
jgi:hypothetical protein